MMDYYDTIAAVSTPRGKGGVALIRISGPDAIAVGEKVFSKKLSEVGSNRAVYGDIYLLSADGTREKIDDGLATVFRAPRSFTGEDTVEICCHGGVLITETVLSSCFAAGARQATAGEFTRRAYVNGKTGLDAAEALGALLEAGNTAQLRLARSGMSGRLSAETDAIYENILNVAAELRADIDFPDEDVSEMTDDELKAAISGALEKIVGLAATYATGRAIADGVKTVICGRTNSGKSSLFNLMVGYDAAIVTDIEGTTRDILRDTVSFGGVTLRLSDTAGIRSTDDTVEQIGVDRARGEMLDAELILAVIDGSREPDTEDDRLVKEVISSGNAYKIAVINKSDVATIPGAERLAGGFDATVVMSAATGEGAEKLAELISAAFLDGNIDINRDTVVSTGRQYGALVTAADSLRAALDGLERGLPVDLVSSDIESALSELASVGGRETSEEIISGIFSKFCVGK